MFEQYKTYFLFKKNYQKNISYILCILSETHTSFDQHHVGLDETWVGSLK